MSLAENIKKLRKKQGLSQEKLAQLSGITFSSIQKIEQAINTNPSLDTLTALSKALKVSIDKLVK